MTTSGQMIRPNPGDVFGPASATDNAVPVYDGITGKKIKDSLVTVDGSGNIATPGTVDGRDLSTDGTKLDGVESGATADQTGAEIKVAYEAEADTNAFTDAEKTKLTGIETGATEDQSDAEIKTAYENNANTNEFSDSEQTKLAGMMTVVNSDTLTDGSNADDLHAHVEKTAENFVFAYDTTTQIIALANTFQGLDFATNGQLNGWTHTPGTSIFGCNQTGIYLVNVKAIAEKTGGGTNEFAIRALFNAIEVAGSQMAIQINSNNVAIILASTFMVSATSGQNLELEVAGSNTSLQILPGPNPGSAVTVPSAQITIMRLA